MDKKEELIAYFKTEIQDSSAQEISTLKDEIKAIQTQVLQDIEQQAKQAADAHFALELSELNADHAIALSHINDENNARLMAERQRMVDEIFDEVKMKLADYTKSKAYAKKLEEKLCDVKHKNLTPAILYIRKEDECLLPDLLAIYELPCVGSIDGNIHIGGFRLECVQRGIVIDETFDSAFGQSRKWFYDTSGLVIR